MANGHANSAINTAGIRQPSRVGASNAARPANVIRYPFNHVANINQPDAAHQPPRIAEAMPCSAATAMNVFTWPGYFTNSC